MRACPYKCRASSADQRPVRTLCGVGDHDMGMDLWVAGAGRADAGTPPRPGHHPPAAPHRCDRGGRTPPPAPVTDRGGDRVSMGGDDLGLRSPDRPTPTPPTLTSAPRTSNPSRHPPVRPTHGAPVQRADSPERTRRTRRRSPCPRGRAVWRRSRSNSPAPRRHPGSTPPPHAPPPTGSSPPDQTRASQSTTHPLYAQSHTWIETPPASSMQMCGTSTRGRATVAEVGRRLWRRALRMRLSGCRGLLRSRHSRGEPVQASSVMSGRCAAPVPLRRGVGPATAEGVARTMLIDAVGPDRRRVAPEGAADRSADAYRSPGGRRSPDW